ncbi:MAG: hypothetical protein ABIJ46_01520 [bacterium]
MIKSERHSPVTSVDDFFLAVEGWRIWLELQKEELEGKLAVAKSKPNGLSHDGDLRLSSSGRVFRLVVDRGRHRLFRLERVPHETHHGSYEKVLSCVPQAVFFDDRGVATRVRLLDISVLVFLAWSGRDYRADFGWYDGQAVFPQWPPEAELLQDDLGYCRNGLCLTKTILSQQDQVSKLILARAGQQSKLRNVVGPITQDHDILFRMLDSGLNGLPVLGLEQILNPLHELLDQLSLGRQVRIYR